MYTSQIFYRLIRFYLIYLQIKVWNSKYYCLWEGILSFIGLYFRVKSKLRLWYCRTSKKQRSGTKSKWHIKSNFYRNVCFKKTVTKRKVECNMETFVILVFVEKTSIYKKLGIFRVIIYYVSVFDNMERTKFASSKWVKEKRKNYWILKTTPSRMAPYFICKTRL